MPVKQEEKEKKRKKSSDQQRLESMAKTLRL
jgi:hypothetical protein